MRAIILAAGRGERLKGVVNGIPKPMVKIDGKPILEHNILWLGGFGIKELYINLHHAPSVIRDYFGDGGKWGVGISYSYEDSLLGTAGAVRKIVRELFVNEGSLLGVRKSGLTDNRSQITGNWFLVVYGDNLLSEFDLAKIVEFHKIKRGIGTMCLYHKNDVSQSGIVVIDKEGRIVRFIEKPSPGEAVSNLVNTGIYVLEPEILGYIPEGLSDFGRDVFPEIIDAGEDLYGIVQDAGLIAIDTPELLERIAKIENRKT